MALTLAQQRILEQARTQGLGTVQEMLHLAGADATPENYRYVRKLLQSVGESAPATRAEVYAEEAAAGPRQLTDWERDFVERKVKPNNWGVSDISNYFQQAGHNVTQDQIRTIAQSAGLELTNSLTPAQRRILEQARSQGAGTVQEMLDIAGIPASMEAYGAAKSILDNAAIKAPMTRAEVYGDQAAAAIAAGQTRQLTDWERDFVERKVKPNGWSAADISNYFQQAGHPVTSQDIQAIAKAAGLTLQGEAYLSPGQGPTQPALNPQQPEFDGGTPGRQPEGGMYGGINLPAYGQVPEHPQLRDIFGQMRRKAANNLGRTDTILTSGRGVTGEAMIKRRTLSGS